jgi:hypothetical protein
MAAMEGCSAARRAVSALQWKGRKPSGVMRSSSRKGAMYAVSLASVRKAFPDRADASRAALR